MSFLDRKIVRQIIQFCKFGAVGVLNNIISLAVYYIVVFINPQLYLLGNALGFLLSTLNAYFMNSRFVFSQRKENRHQWRQMGKTYAVYTCSLLLSTLILYVLVGRLQISDKLAPLCSLMVTVPFNFMLNKFWVYRKDTSAK